VEVEGVARHRSVLAVVVAVELGAAVAVVAADNCMVAPELAAMGVAVAPPDGNLSQPEDTHLRKEWSTSA
jgi:hypothetical protein